MNGTPLGNHPPNTPEWDQLRANGLGGSEIAAVVGLSPWVSPFALYHRKRGTIDKQKVNAGMDWGHRLEDAICEAFADTHDHLHVEPAGTFCNSDRPWQIANPDRLLYDTDHWPDPVGLLEVKTAHQYDAHEWGPSGSDEIPPYYRCQVLWYLDTLQLPVAHVAVLIGGSDYREYAIDYAADEAEWLRGQGERFWADVVAGNPPPIDGHDATYQAVRELHPDINGEDVEIPGELYADYACTKKAFEGAKEAHQKAKTTVLDAMGQAKRAYFMADDTQVPVLRRQPGRGGSVSLQPIPKPKTKKEDAA